MVYEEQGLVGVKVELCVGFRDRHLGLQRESTRAQRNMNTGHGDLTQALQCHAFACTRALTCRVVLGVMRIQRDMLTMTSYQDHPVLLDALTTLPIGTAELSPPGASGGRSDRASASGAALKITLSVPGCVLAARPASVCLSQCANSGGTIAFMSAGTHTHKHAYDFTTCASKYSSHVPVFACLPACLLVHVSPHLVYMRGPIHPV